MFLSRETENLVLPDVDDVYGVAFRDINQDGFADLYLTRFRNINRLFVYSKNREQYKDKTISAGLGGNLYPRGIKNLELGASIVDYNNDGLQEVTITGWGTTTRFYHQARRLKFEDHTSDLKIENQLSGNASVWSDVNVDGRLDVLITNEHGRNALYLQNINGAFRESSSEYNLITENTSQSAAFSDVNLDGYPDLYICNWLAPDEFYLNVDGVKFESRQLNISHLTDSLNSNGVSFGDIDNDGDPDLLVTDRGGLNRLYRNDYSKTDSSFSFADISSLSNISNTLPAYSGIIADLDNNGWQDILFTNIGENALYLNDSNGLFNLYSLAGKPNQHYSTGAAGSDFNNDGNLDVFISNKDTTSILYVNPGTKTRSSIRIIPKGVFSNRDGIGAKVWLYASVGNTAKHKLLGYREISGGSGYLSIGETVAHFGVEPTGVYSAVIKFPSGKTKTLNDLFPGQSFVVQELDGLPYFFARIHKQLSYLITQAAFWYTLVLVVVLIASIGVSMAVFLKRYQWTGKQTGGFLSAVLIALYIVYAVFRGEPAWIVLGSQVITILTGLLITSAAMEYLLVQKKRRSVYRTALYNFSEQLIFLRDNNTLYEQLVEMIHQTMCPEFCVVYAFKNGNLSIKHSAGILLEDKNPRTITPSQLDILLSDKTVSGTVLSKHFSEFHQNNCDLLVPVVRNDTVLSLITIGKPTRVRGYDHDDINTFILLANQTALAVENNYFIEKTKELTRQITEAETQEKYITVLEKQNKELESLYAELKDAHLQLVQSEKMSSLGQLVAGVAHELNNPIGFIYGNMRELQRYIQKMKDPKLMADTSEMEFIKNDIDSLILETIDGSTRVKQIVEDLRNFSRLDEAEFKHVDIHEGLDSTLSLLRKELSDRIMLHKEYGDLPKIDCMPGQINQVFMNLLQNAIHAIPKKGNIWVKTSMIENEIVINVVDDGNGIPKGVIGKIFDPFFTTKDVGKGTGLGLSICYKIVENHGGSLQVDSKPNDKTNFTIHLPLKR